jgi:hypothetical protein
VHHQPHALAGAGGGNGIDGQRIGAVLRSQAGNVRKRLRLAVGGIHLAAAPGTLAARLKVDAVKVRRSKSLIILPPKRGFFALSGMVDWPQKTCPSMFAAAPTIRHGRH